MIILFVRDGQTCNQLLSLAGLFALAKETGEKTICPVFDEKLKDYFVFSFQANDDTSNFVLKSTLFGRTFRLIINKLKVFFIKAFGYNLTELGKRNRLLFNWFSFIDQGLLIRYSEDIRRYFAIRPKYIEHCYSRIDKFRLDYDVIVGVHIRRGDYRDFQSGKWYYDDHQYICWLKHLQDSSEVSVLFLLFSNEEIDIKAYTDSGLNVQWSAGTMIEDLASLSLCDFVIGPPSTYSFWAAFYGNKKRCILDDRNNSYEWNDFLYYEDRYNLGENLR